MEESKRIIDLDEQASVSDNDAMIIDGTNGTKKMSFLSLSKWLLNKLQTMLVTGLTTKDKTICGSLIELSDKSNFIRYGGNITTFDLQISNLYNNGHRKIINVFDENTSSRPLDVNSGYLETYISNEGNNATQTIVTNDNCIYIRQYNNKQWSNWVSSGGQIEWKPL